jgi:hypothetical protein
MWAGRRDDDHVAQPINVEEMFATLARWIRPGIVEPEEVPGTAGDGSRADPANGLAGIAATDRYWRS